MTLGTDTIALLRYSVDALLHLTGPVPYARLSPDERRSALMQLMVTTETAAKIAEVGWSPPKQSGGDAECINAETERLKVEAVKVERETERAARETERLKAEADKVRAETEKVGKEMEKVTKQIELTMRETLRLKVEGEKVEKQAVRAVRETEKIKAEEVKDVERLVAGRESMEAEQAKVAKDEEVDKRARELTSAELEIETVEKQILRSMQETNRLRVELVQVRNKQSINDSDMRELRGKLEIKMSMKPDPSLRSFSPMAWKEAMDRNIRSIQQSIEILAEGGDGMKAEEDRVGRNLQSSVEETGTLQNELIRLRIGMVLQRELVTQSGVPDS